MSFKHPNDEEVTEPRPAPTLNEGTPTRVMLRDSKISNPGESRNKRTRLPEMPNIGIGAPGTRGKGNLTECA